MKSLEQPIESFCETGSGSTPNRGNAEYFGGITPWVKSGELRDGVILTTEERVTPEGIAAARLKIVPAGSILVAMYGATVGRTALLGIDATTNQAVCHVRPNSRLADTRYVWFALQAKLPELLSRRVGGAQPNISQETIRSTRVYLPPLPEQRRIADILDKADAIRRKRKEAITLTEELLRSAFLEMFGDPVRNPRGWAIRTMGELAEVNRGRFTPRPRNDPQFYGGAFPFIQTGDLSNCSGYLRSWKQTLNEKGCGISRGFPRGSIAIAIAANIGDTAIVDFDFWCPDSVVGIIPRHVPVEYLEMHLRFQQAQLEAGAPETAQKNINLETLRPLAIMMPPKQQLGVFASAYRRCHALITRYEMCFAESNHLFSSLVHRAFRGELTAPTSSKKKQLDMFDADP